MATVLHLTGPILLGPDDERAQAWVIDGRITYSPPAGSHEVQTIAGYVLPGLVDAHCHLGLGSGGGVDEATTREQAETDRDAGTLLIRDAGSPVDNTWVQHEDDLPRLVRAGRHVARPYRYIRGVGVDVEPDDLVAAVREQARRGDGWVKLAGDWIDREVGDLTPLWPVEALTAAIAAAHDEGAKVTAHCFGEQSLRDFAAAGTDCIEHASGLTDETIELFAAQDIAIVPTMVNLRIFPEIAAPAREKFPAYHRHMLDLWQRRHQTLRKAHEAGIRIFAGTDAGGGILHGLIAQECLELSHIGMSNEQVLDAVTWQARPWLGFAGLDEGADADLVVYAGDPRADLHALLDPAAIVLRGRRIR